MPQDQKLPIKAKPEALPAPPKAYGETCQGPRRGPGTLQKAEWVVVVVNESQHADHAYQEQWLGDRDWAGGCYPRLTPEQYGKLRRP
jgi:hypothetical protein